MTSVFLALLRAEGIPAPVPEFRFFPARRWRMDFAWPDHLLALEVQGAIFTGGRHTRGAALLKEWEKLNTAASVGWRFIYCQPSDLLNHSTIQFIKQSLTYEPGIRQQQ